MVDAVKFNLQNDLLLEYTITQVFKVIFVSRGSVNCLTNNLFCLRVMWSGTQVCLHSLDFLLPLCTTRTMLLRKQEMSLQVSACESADQKTSGQLNSFLDLQNTIVSKFSLLSGNSTTRQTN